ncbi:hypothetical protein GIB67_004802 [Kingdonia uniflora]|uniref:Uncharacterized protein n=1 Tax=Kingdonia uniflora TaxID=39325 RepID=A0A7J7LNJ8_9MAGN|nr:hypothetical protein GIB67_004802 [Kingdonia uniflora]
MSPGPFASPVLSPWGGAISPFPTPVGPGNTQPIMSRESGRPKGSVKRTELFLGCHIKQDGTFPEQMKDRMVIEREKSKNSQFADEVVSVRQKFEEKLEVEASKRRRLEERIGAFELRKGRDGINMYHASPSNVSFSQAIRYSPPPDGVKGRNCIIKDMYGRTVAYESIQLSGVAPEGFYRIIVDEVIHDDVQLLMEGGTLGDISTGETVIWYKSLTCFG